MELTDDDHQLVAITTKTAWRRNRSNYRRQGYEFEDLVQIAYEALLIATERHDLDKAPLHYFKRIYIRGYLLNALNRRLTQARATIALGTWSSSISEPETFDHDRQQRYVLAVQVREVVERFMHCDVDLTLLHQHYFGGQTQRAIAEQYALTPSRVSAIIRKGRHKLRTYLTTGDENLFTQRDVDPRLPTVTRYREEVLSNAERIRA